MIFQQLDSTKHTETLVFLFIPQILLFSFSLFVSPKHTHTYTHTNT